MKFFKWKDFLITSIVCLSPIVLGILLWDKLPETMAIHFDIKGNPDNFAKKGFVVLGLPVLMALAQAVLCFATDFNSKKRGGSKKFETVAKWIIPIMTSILQLATLGIGLGILVDIRVVAGAIVGVVLIVLGNYMPKLDYVKNYKIEPEKAKKINRFMGVESVIMGFLFLISLFLPPIATVVCIILLIPYTLIGVIYGLYVTRKK